MKSRFSELLLKALKLKLEKHQGLALFARERAKFEGWLKVEVCEILNRYFEEVCPERGRVDVCFQDTFIELKTLNTNLGYQQASSKIRPITKNTQGVITDIAKLGKIKGKHKYILFIVFPANHENHFWQKQFQRIKTQVPHLIYKEFYFRNKLPGIIYLGRIY